MNHRVTVAVAVLVALALACVERPPESVRSPGTIAMAQRLQQIAADPDPRNPYSTAARLAALRETDPGPDPRRRLAWQGAIAQELLHLGRYEEAVQSFEALLDALADYGGQAPAGYVLAIRESVAIARLKLWERENCVQAGSSDACAFPIQPGGSVVRVRDARSAFETYRALLEAEPDNLTNRWLFNLAGMMIGEYPGGIPARWRIPAAAIESEFDPGRFPEIAAGVGLDVSARAGGSVMDDFDGDGDLDILTSSWHLRDPLRFFVNQGDGAFAERTLEAGLEGITGGLNLIQADYDNDGDLDLLVLRGAWQPVGEPNSLLRNDGDGRFEDVTIEAGLGGEHSTQTASWGDYDNDGWLDLYVGHESEQGRRTPNQLFHNQGDGTFRDVAAATGTDVVGFVKAVCFGDVDNDGRLDLFISRLNEPNLLLRGEGPDASGSWRFSDITAAAGVAEPSTSFPAWFWDYDNDGWLDIFVSGYRAIPGDIAAEYLGLPHRAELPRLYRNDGAGTFSDVTSEARLDRITYAMGANYGDLDNDGFPDVYAGTGDPDFRLMVPNRAYRNSAGRFFQDVTSAGGFGHLGKGHGVSFGDIDGDGDQDIHVTIGGMFDGDLARNALYRNPGHGNRWITLRLEGVRSNRSAIGARIRVVIRTATGSRTVHSVVSSGGSFGANSLQQEIGLGDALRIDSIEVTWPATGLTDSFGPLEMDRVYEIREGEGEARLSGPA